MNWTLRRRGDGRQHGPLNDDALRRWAWDDCILSSDELSSDNGMTWVRAEDLGWLNSFMSNREQATASEKMIVSGVRRRSSRTARSLLDLTPMVDCVFLLLLFFFVTATFDEHESNAMSEASQATAAVELDVSVPQVEDEPQPEIELPRDLYVVVSADGSLLYDGRPHTLDALQQVIRARLQDGHALTAIVLAEPDVQYRHIAATVAAIEAAGVDRVLLGATGGSE